VLLEELLLSCVDAIKTDAAVGSLLSVKGFRWWGLHKDLFFDSDKSWLDIAASMGRDHSEFSETFDKMDAALFTPSCIESENNVPLFPLQPLFDKLEGFDLFGDRSKASGGDAHWHPWLYEVLIQQWSAVLSVIQKAPVTTLAQSSILYPESLSKRIEESSNKVNKKDIDVRVLMLGHGPLVLKLITKSLGLRITRQYLRAPVIIDEYLQSSLERLVELLAAEVVFCLTNGSWRSRKLNNALAQFIRGLFAIVAPLQVYNLVQAYFRRPVTRKEEVDLRIEFLDELSQYDQFVAINFPLPMYTDLTYFEMNSM
jgi:hypothetical protein